MTSTARKTVLPTPMLEEASSDEEDEQLNERIQLLPRPVGGSGSSSMISTKAI